MTTSRLIGTGPQGIPGPSYYSISASGFPSSPVEGQLYWDSVGKVLWIYSSSGWREFGSNSDWTSYSPAWSGTIGNGSIQGAVARYGRTTHFRAQVIWGSTTSHAATPQTLTLPYAMKTSGFGYGTAAVVGQSSCLQTGVEAWFGSCLLNNPGAPTTLMIIAGTSQVSGTQGRITNLIPFTWASTHVLQISGTYEAIAS